MEELEFYKDFFENAPDLFVSIDPTTAKVKNCNLTLVKTLGYAQKSEIIGRQIFELYHEDCLPDVEKAFQLFRTEGKVDNFRLKLKKKDGSPLHVSLNVSAIRNEQGTVIGSRSIWRDITDQVNQEQKITQLSNIIENLKTRNLESIGHLESITKDFNYSEPYLSRALNAMTDGVVIANEKGELVAWNEAGNKIMAIESTREISNNHYKTHGYFELDKVTPIPSKDLPLEKSISGDCCENREIFLINSEKPEGAFILVNAHPVFNKSNQCIGGIAIIIDITDKKTLELNIAEKNKELHKNNLELEKFAYVASHDLKAPLRGITSLTSMIEEDLEDYFSNNDANPDIKKNLDRMHRRVNRMNDLIEGILDYSKAGKEHSNLEWVNIKKLIETIFDEQSTHKSTQLIYSDQLPTIKADPIKLEQIFSNLISNAIKYHNNLQEAEIRIDAIDKGDFYKFCVTDNGPGIAPKYHHKVFEMFQTLQPRDVIESTGIGLSIVKKLVEHQGGEISLASDLGMGSTFKFTWPKA